ncbi:MAG: hypothetical protein LBJ48_00240 [Coriobacteriales bacterium]|nr:hypothetical protein [Coriobacteriales bacterium]
MSICIDVIPSIERIPTTGELAAETESILEGLAGNPLVEEIWKRDGVSPKGVLVELLEEMPDEAEGSKRCSDPLLLLSMDGYSYGWLSADNYKIGFDFYFDSVERDGDADFFREFIGDDMASLARERGKLHDFPFKQASCLGYRWYMRGRVGRPRSTWLLAGVAATALAHLTAGILFSDDGGADYERMPEAPDAFLEWFPSWCMDEWDC